MICAHACTCLYGFGLAMSFSVQFKEIAVCLWGFFSTPCRLRQYLCALFLMICESVYVCIYLNVCFNFPRCIILTPGLLTTLSFILFHPACCLLSYRLPLWCASQLSFQLYFTRFVWRTWQILCSSFRATYLPLLVFSPRCSSVCVWHIRSLWSCESSTERLLSLLVPLRANWHRRLSMCGGSCGRWEMTPHWCGEAGDAAA